MTALKPVSFKKGRAHLPRISKPYVPGKRHERYWTDAEVEIVRQHYPKGGAAACIILLPGRTISGVHQQARKAGLNAIKGGKKKEPITPPADIDERLRAAWPSLSGRGAVNALADELKLPRWWVSKRALKLGLTNPQRKEPIWTEAEKELMKKVPLYDLEKCAKIFRQHGFNRTPTSIGVKAKRLSLSRRATREAFSGTQVAKILGLDSKTVTSWCIKGEMKATRRSDKRLPQQGGSSWDIQPGDLRRYIIDNLEYIDFRKVDKFAVVHLLTEVA